jgi:hypothetical protein
LGSYFQPAHSAKALAKERSGFAKIRLFFAFVSSSRRISASQRNSVPQKTPFLRPRSQKPPIAGHSNSAKISTP